LGADVLILCRTLQPGMDEGVVWEGLGRRRTV